MNKIEEGKKAPEFTGVDQNGEEVKLEKFKGKKIVLFFYPKDDTPGCTKEACNLRDNYAVLQEKGFEVIGVSADTVKKHKKFETKYALPYTLLADESKEILTAFGAWGKKKFMGREYEGILRTTYVLDTDRTVLKRFDKVITKDHTNQILDELKLN